MKIGNSKTYTDWSAERLIRSWIKDLKQGDATEAKLQEGYPELSPPNSPKVRDST